MTFDTIKLDKGLYTTDKGFSAALESIDPSENYKGTELEGLDAFQRQLKRFDIKVSGGASDTVSKFFQTTDSAALFPEYVSRAVKQGIEEQDTLSKVVAATTVIDSMDYRSIEADFSEEDLTLMEVAEGAFIPETKIKTKDELTPLKKYGRMLVASYEAIKFQRLDLFTLMLRRIGAEISKTQMNDLIAKLLILPIGSCARIDPSELSYQDLLNLWAYIAPYRMTTLIAGRRTVAKIMGMSEFRDAAAGLNFHATGNMITPFGAEIICNEILEGADTIIGLDNRYTVEQIKAGEVATDFDKLIDRQLERATISTITGFSVLFKDAAAAL
jgi:hypothetical protein